MIRVPIAQILLWGSRLLAIAIALWWPPIWRDPIYTPRQARLTGQELRLPSGALPKTDDERAFAIFSAWENRSLVTTQWVIGPYRGFRHPNGWMQTFVAIVTFWLFGSVLFSFLPKTPIPPSEPQERKGLRAVLTTPLWHFLSRSRHSAS
jgi:hypothetical protein